ncbi:GNAT family N-acetyltransferase [Actinopolymorpha alba]|uniref:GNAT family N-acetyltransferase n=1 Tax=Actinopolymorpha alba TaxID=533267 RepID=UPI00037437CD|nr:GNAT family N-acetyltransferase [Actinopolymorpha alba]
MCVAIDAGQWIGFSATSIQRAEDCAYSMMTGILRSHRGRGLSLALKLAAITFARESGVQWLRADHHPANAPAIAMNRRLGFVPV